MNVWALNENHDMYLDNDGNIARIAGLDDIAQHIKTRLLLFFGEWFMDVREGVPWFQEIFVKPANITTAESIIKTEILETQGVIELLEFSIDFDPANRILNVVKFTAKTEFGLLEETI